MVSSGSFFSKWTYFTSAGDGRSNSGRLWWEADDWVRSSHDWALPLVYAASSEPQNERTTDAEALFPPPQQWLKDQWEKMWDWETMTRKLEVTETKGRVPNSSEGSAMSKITKYRGKYWSWEPKSYWWLCHPWPQVEPTAARWPAHNCHLPSPEHQVALGPHPRASVTAQEHLHER